MSFSNLAFLQKNVKIAMVNFKNAKIQENYKFCFYSYLRNHLSYRDVQYLSLKPLTNYYDF